MRYWLLTLCLVLMLTGCTAAEKEPIEAVGCWVSDSPDAYYFELYDDGRCVMFDKDDNWASEGTYKTNANQILFDMDTGSFSWAKREDEMVFEAADGVITYRLQDTTVTDA